MADWRQIRKIDAHIHIVPDEVHKANPDSGDVWAYADAEKYKLLMNRYNIEKALIMPLNDPWLMSMDFTVSAVHKNLYAIKQQYPDLFFAFADIDARNSSEGSAAEICRAIETYQLDGIKIHPNNTGVELDSPYNQAIFTLAQTHKIPVAIHGYPNTDNDLCAAKRVLAILERYPDLTVIVSHMGAFQWEALVNTSAFVDMSAILPAYVDALGIQKTNEILRQFGPQRLIFATDYPDNRTLEPGEIYEAYFHILDQMDFTEEEAEQIACKNILTILGK